MAYIFLLCALYIDCFSLVPFRIGAASCNLINVLNKTALLSLQNNDINEGKVRINITKNPNTTFLTRENATSELINNLVIKILFSDSPKLVTVSNSQKIEMDIYKSMLLVIIENRFVLPFIFTLNILFYILYLFIF